MLLDRSHARLEHVSGMLIMHQTFAKAVKVRRNHRVFYDGHGWTVESHVFGVNAVGRSAVSCYRIGSGTLPGRLRGLEDAVAMEARLRHDDRADLRSRTSTPVEGANPMSQVFAQV